MPATAIAFEVLGVRARVGSDRASELEHLRSCWAALPARDGPPDVDARVTTCADGFEILVAGRERVLAADPIQAVRALNHELMHAIMRRRPDLLFVHAGVVAWDERAIVLPGVSRAGKSTLVLALLAAGARFLSDELLVWDAANGVARAFPRAPKLRDECVAYFPALLDACAGEGEGRFVPIEALGSTVVESAVPIAIVEPRWEAHRSDRLERITAAAAVLRLAASALNFGARGAGSIEPLAALAESTVAWRLEWRDPHAAAALVVGAVRALGS